MSNGIGGPQVHVRELDSGNRTLSGLGTSIPAFLGYTLQGPNTPTCVSSFAEFEDLYVGHAPSPAPDADAPTAPPPAGPRHLAEAVYDFFLNGGSECYIVSLRNGKALADAALAGNRESNTGLAGLEAIQEVSLVVAAGVRPPAGTPEHDKVLETLADHCVAMGNRVVIVDTPGPAPQAALISPSTMTVEQVTAAAGLRADTNIVRWTEFDRSGHFAAMEQPELLVGDIRTFFREPAA